MGSHVAPGCTWGKPPCQSGPIIAHRIAHSCTAAAQSAHPSALPTPARLQRAGANPKAHHASPGKGSSGRPSRRLSRARHAQRGGAQRCSSLGRRADAPWPCPGGMQQAGSRWCALGSVWGFWQPAVTAAALPPLAAAAVCSSPFESACCVHSMCAQQPCCYTPRTNLAGYPQWASAAAAAAARQQPASLSQGLAAATLQPLAPAIQAPQQQQGILRQLEQLWADSVRRKRKRYARLAPGLGVWKCLGLCDHSRCPTRMLFCLSALSPRESMLWLIALIAPPLTPNPLRRSGP